MEYQKVRLLPPVVAYCQHRLRRGDIVSRRDLLRELDALELVPELAGISCQSESTAHCPLTVARYLAQTRLPAWIRVRQHASFAHAPGHSDGV